MLVFREFEFQNSGGVKRHNSHYPEQLLRRNVKLFRAGLVFKAHRLLYHSTLGLSVIKKKKKKTPFFTSWKGARTAHSVGN